MANESRRERERERETGMTKMREREREKGMVSEEGGEERERQIRLTE